MTPAKDLLKGPYRQQLEINIAKFLAISTLNFAKQKFDVNLELKNCSLRYDFWVSKEGGFCSLACIDLRTSNSRRPMSRTGLLLHRFDLGMEDFF